MAVNKKQGEFAIYQGPDGAIRRSNGRFTREELQAMSAALDLLAFIKRLVDEGTLNEGSGSDYRDALVLIEKAERRNA